MLPKFATVCTVVRCDNKSVFIRARTVSIKDRKMLVVVSVCKDCFEGNDPDARYEAAVAADATQAERM